ncbi:putative DMT superfamily transporter inner membrane protein [Roseovarius litorisediminis]|uniref:Putative DMT superfamily transporter inner membrane protein n=1 Tax=Roseovarius litorisediminis TaxID=1312363 RepID=A0A1Y5T0I0_9RHOB|nr:DMT family transporter [Roseovarius litorisediminis]SLN53113.1 putative DMT superfamily transporter inner membrane protein [Roseovarius litorisediminis]
MKQPTLRLTPISALMLLALAAVWGGSFFFAEVALAEVPPLTIALHRVFWAVPCLAMLIRLRGIPLARAPRVWGAYLVMGALNNAIPFSLIFWGQTQIESGLASILNGMTAIFGAVVAGLLLADERLTAGKIMGAVFGLAGVAVIIGPKAMYGLDPRNLAQLAVLAGAFSYALASVWGKTMLAGQAPQMNALGMLTGSSVLMIPVVIWIDGVPEVGLSLPVWGALGALSVLSTALAYLLYFAILVRAGAANLMLVTLLIPPFAIALGAGVLDERLPPGALGGFALIGFALVLTDGRALARIKDILRPAKS